MRLSRLAGLVATALFVAGGALAAPGALGADRVYWSNTGTAEISFAGVDGSGGGDINLNGATGGVRVGLTLDPLAGRVYWANFNFIGSVSFADLDGAGGGDLKAEGATNVLPTGVAIDPAAKRIYWSSRGQGFFSPPAISFGRLDGGGGENLNTGGATLDQPSGVALDPAAGRIYWANGAGKISFARLDGSGGQDLNTAGATTTNLSSVAVDPAAGLIYWTNTVDVPTGAGKIAFARLDGSGGGDLNITGVPVQRPRGIAIDHAAGRIYWANIGDGAVRGSGGIFTAKLDGSDARKLNIAPAQIDNPTHPVLLAAPRPVVPPAITGGSTEGSVLSCSQGEWAGDVTPSFFFGAAQSFAFQWTRDGKDVAGATGSSLTASEAGDYRCRVTAQNRAGGTAETSALHAVPDVTAPVLSSVSLSRKRFRVRKAPRGSKLRFVSSEAGRLSLRIESVRLLVKGKKRRATLARGVKAGRGNVAISGRVRGKALPAGRYRVTVSLRDEAGNVSTPVRRPFTILP